MHANQFPYIVVLLLVPRWSDAKYDARMAKAFANWTTQIEQEMTSIGAHESFTYLNYAAPSQNPLASYGQANLQFLKQVAKKYDPQGVFQTLVPGGSKVSKA